MSTTAEALSDALVAALTAAIPTGAQVLDHEVLPIRREDVAAAGTYGVFLIEDAPDGDGFTFDQETSRRIATFKVPIRVTGDPRTLHLVKATSTQRALVETAIAKDPTLGGLAYDTRITAWRPLVLEPNSSVACAEIDISALYRYVPELS